MEKKILGRTCWKEFVVNLGRTVVEGTVDASFFLRVNG